MATPTLDGPNRDPWPDSLWIYDEPNIDTEINLGDEGLSPGDDVSSYVAQHKGNGVRLIIPKGEYTCSSRNDLLSLPGGSYHLKGKGGLGDVVIQQESPTEGPYLEVNQANVRAVIENIDLVGPLPPETDSGLGARVTETDSELIFKRFRMPDGQESGGSDIASGLYVDSNRSGDGHQGSIRLLWCQMSNFGDNGMYADGPNSADHSSGDPYYGRVIVVGGYYSDNNISNIRLGNPYSTVYAARVEYTGGMDPDYTENYRGIRIRRPAGEVTHFNTFKMLIANCHIRYTSGGSGGSGTISCHDEVIDGVNGVFENCFIENDHGGTNAILWKDSSISDHWTLDNIHITGSGDLGVEGNSLENSPTPGSSSAESPDMTPWWGSGEDTSGSGDSDGGDGDGGEDGGDTSYDFELTIDSGSEIDYTFRATESIDPAYDHSDFPANDETEPPGDYVCQNSYGGDTALGHSGGGGDTYYITGNITEFSVVSRDGSTPTYTLLQDGTEVTEDELVIETTDDDPDSISDPDTPDLDSDLKIEASSPIKYYFECTDTINLLYDYSTSATSTSDYIKQKDDGTYAAVGYCDGGEADYFNYDGEITSVRVISTKTGVEPTYTLYRDGQVWENPP